MMCSRAVVLVGGLGTRLRPLTTYVPKPLVPIAGVPLMTRLLQRLRQHGFTDVVLAVQYLADQFRSHYAEADLGLRLSIVEEPEPLGTAGALRYALADVSPAPTLVLNGDELSTLDWRSLCTAHTRLGGWGTIAVRTVADPSAFGVVVADAQQRVLEWQEKPAPGTARATTINSGAYVLEPAAIAAIPAGFAMLERDLFPLLLATGAPLYAQPHTAYSQDIGTLAGYLAASGAVLRGELAAYAPTGHAIAPGVWAAADVVVDPTAVLRAPIFLGTGSRVAAGTHLENVVAWDHVTIGPDAHIQNVALAARSIVADGVWMINQAYGPDSEIK